MRGEFVEEWKFTRLLWDVVRSLSVSGIKRVYNDRSEKGDTWYVDIDKHSVSEHELYKSAT